MKRALTWISVLVVGACGGGGPNPDDPDAAPGADADPDVDARPPERPATRFEDTADNYPVPSSGLPEGFGPYFSFGGVRYWTTFDLDGDGHLDIVQTGDTSVGQQVWDA